MFTVYIHPSAPRPENYATFAEYYEAFSEWERKNYPPGHRKTTYKYYAQHKKTNAKKYGKAADAVLNKKNSEPKTKSKTKVEPKATPKSKSVSRPVASEVKTINDIVDYIDKHVPELASTKAMQDLRSAISLGQLGVATHPGQATRDVKPPTEEELWNTTKEIHEEIRKENLHFGTGVAIPEMADHFLDRHPGHTVGEFHKLLKKWQKEDLVTLQYCSDRRYEDRFPEGIDSPSGMLFYVQINKK